MHQKLVRRHPRFVLLGVAGGHPRKFCGGPPLLEELGLLRAQALHRSLLRVGFPGPLGHRKAAISDQPVALPGGIAGSFALISRIVALIGTALLARAATVPSVGLLAPGIIFAAPPALSFVLLSGDADTRLIFSHLSND